LPYGFIPFPVFNHGGNTLEKNIDYAGCNYLSQSFDYYLANTNTFLAENAVFDTKMLEPVRIALGMSRDDIDGFRAALADMLGTPGGKEHTLDFLIIYYLSDAIVAKQFDGIKVLYNFTEHQQFLVDNAQKWPVIKVFDFVARKLFMSRIFRQPLDAMAEVIRATLANQEPETPKYLLFSAHDTQIGNIIEWL
jgi:hypothetical protein